jgi:hypothetical protein
VPTHRLCTASPTQEAKNRDCEVGSADAASQALAFHGPPDDEVPNGSLHLETASVEGALVSNDEGTVNPPARAIVVGLGHLAHWTTT